MKLTIISVFITVFLFSILAISSTEVKAQPYLPVGPQTNVPVSTVTGGGWTECYRDVYANSMNPNEVLSGCNSNLLMMACRRTESDTLTLLAQGKRSDVTFDTGNNLTVTHIANGVGWYFSTVIDTFRTGSWGFVKAGDIPTKFPCDSNNNAATGKDRLCWHLGGGIGGWRCGTTQRLSNSTAFERIVYQASAPQLTVELNPTTAINQVQTDHTVTATVLANGAPLPGAPIEFEIISGPNAGGTSDPDSGECTPNNDCTTDSNGEVSWTYTGSLTEGTDTIIATFNGFEVVESNSAEKTWALIRNIPTLSEWGLIAMAGILGIVGFMVIRRRKAAA